MEVYHLYLDIMNLAFPQCSNEFYAFSNQITAFVIPLFVAPHNPECHVHCGESRIIHFANHSHSNNVTLLKHKCYQVPHILYSHPTHPPPPMM